MFRALWIKEWTQLRGLRWIGFLLGIILPLVLLSGAEAGRRGWLPFGKVATYDANTLLIDLMPAMLAGLWGLMSLLLVSQAFTGDRATGTEQFLLERPVPRGRVWIARFLAAGAATLTLIVAHTVYWLLLTQLFTTRPLVFAILFAFGAGALVIGLLGGLGASGFVRTPIHSVILGLVFGLLPFMIAGLFGGLFPLAQVFRVPVGLIVPWLLVIGYVAASWRMACRGEPAGGGRMRRGGIAVGVSLVAVTALFAVAAPLSVRLSAHYSWIQSFVPSRAAPVALVAGGWPPNAWLFDLESARRTRFFPPPVRDAEWSPDGSRLALLHSGSAVGLERSAMWLDVLDTEGQPVAPRVEFDDDEEVVMLVRWALEYVVISAFRPQTGTSLIVFRPGEQNPGRIPLDVRPGSWQFIGPTADGTLYIYRLTRREPRRFGLFRLDPANLRIDPVPLLEEANVEMYATKELSPSGRYWLRWSGEPDSVWRLVDLESGTQRELADTLTAGWLEGDLLARVSRVDGEKRLTVGAPDGEERVLRVWSGRFVRMESSPDQARLLVEVLRPADADDAEDAPVLVIAGQTLADGAALSELLVYDPAGDAWVDITDRFAPPPIYPRERLRWIGTRSVALSGPGHLGITDVDRPDDTLRRVKGRR